MTMFQPKRPWVKWSKVENLLASKKGGSNEVDAVMAKLKFLVTAAMAVMGWYKLSKMCPKNRINEKLTIVGSVMGHCAARRMQLSRLCSYVS